MQAMKMVNIQAALFTIEKIARPDTLYYKLLSEVNDIIDKPPLINNMSEEAPAEIPRVIAVSKDEKYRINISKNRIDFFININGDEGSSESSYSLFKSLTNSLCSQISFMHGISRIGIVSTSIGHDDKLKDIFIDEYLKRVDKDSLLEAEYMTNNVRTHKDKEINNIVKISTGSVIIPTNESVKLLIQLDTNNRTPINERQGWVDIFDHLFDGSSPLAAEKIVRGE